jgi:hypothetical protein
MICGYSPLFPPLVEGRFGGEDCQISYTITVHHQFYFRGSPMTAPKAICQLVDHFEQNRDALLSGKYNEAQLRQEFLNPFFAALGWDMLNTQSFGEAYKEVIHETSVAVLCFTLKECIKDN